MTKQIKVNFSFHIAVAYVFIKKRLTEVFLNYHFDTPFLDL
jgi:hypothetical protein